MKQLVKEQGNAALSDAKKCKALLADYTRNEYKKQSRLLVLTVEEGIPKAIEGADDLPACKKGKIRELEEEHGLNSEFAADIVNLLALVLRGDTTVTVSPNEEKTANQIDNTTLPQKPKEEKISYTPQPPARQKQTSSAPSYSPSSSYSKPRSSYPVKRSGVSRRIFPVVRNIIIAVVAIIVLIKAAPFVKGLFNKKTVPEVQTAADEIIKTTETAEMTGNANFRKGPSTNDAIIRQFKKGDLVILTGEVSGGWTQILRDGELGWVSSEFLKVWGEEKTASPQAAPQPSAQTQTQPKPQTQKQNAEPQTVKQEEAPQATAQQTAVQQAPVSAEEIVDWARGSYPASIVVSANSITGHNINITGARTIVQKPLSGHPNLKWAYVYVGDKKYGVVWDRTTYSRSMHDGIELGIGSEARSAFDFYSGSDKDSIFADISREAPAIKVVK